MTMLKTTAAALAMLPFTAFAQTAEDDIVVTASGFAQPRSETGQAIDIFDRDRLEQLQSGTITEALQTVPGVSIATRGGLGGQSSAFLRGGSSAPSGAVASSASVGALASMLGAVVSTTETLKVAVTGAVRPSLASHLTCGGVLCEEGWVRK